MKDDIVKMQVADPERMFCRDCIYREKDTLKIDGKTIQTGISRATCLIFDGKKGRLKPNSVYFQNEPCMFYEKDETAPKFWERGKK